MFDLMEVLSSLLNLGDFAAKDKSMVSNRNNFSVDHFRLGHHYAQAHTKSVKYTSCKLDAANWKSVIGVDKFKQPTCWLSLFCAFRAFIINLIFYLNVATEIKIIVLYKSGMLNEFIQLYCTIHFKGVQWLVSRMIMG